jgi:alkanesulfonate monooxygenase SsuD/methylene tetrahydromethanopterin reductase-like flavin-dependent oxidoreductase (luciferase family)
MIQGADVLTFGLKASQQHTPIDTLQRVWTIADEGGFDSCWVFDHFAAMGRDRGGDIFEAWTLLGAMAQATCRIRIGCMVTGNSHRHPGILAKMAVTVDHLSAGRLDMGLGAGGDELVHGMLGIPLGPPRERVERLAEACEVLELLWTEPLASFSGRYYRLDQAVANPKPVQRPHPPLWIGAVGERHSLRVVARHAAAWTPSLLPGAPLEELERLSRVLDRRCEEIGRDPATVRRAAQFRLADGPDETLRTAESLVRIGFTDLILMAYQVADAGIAAAEGAVELLPKLRTLG